MVTDTSLKVCRRKKIFKLLDERVREREKREREIERQRETEGEGLISNGFGINMEVQKKGLHSQSELLIYTST